MTTPPTRTERLDALPFTRLHRRLVLGSGAGWALDAMDVGLISFVMAALAAQWDLDTTTLSWVASVGFVGMAVGASLGGLLADRVGRRQVFALTLLVYGLATGAAALSWSVASLLVFRFLIGLGLGAELPVASTLVSEFAPTRIRGRVVVALESFWAVGWLLAALIGYFVVPLSDDGWRWAFALGAVFGCLSGALFAAKIGVIFPHSFEILVSVTALAVIILGGMGSIPGVIVGGLVLVGLPELLREFDEYRLLVYGAVLVAMMLLRPEGLVPSQTRQRELHESDEPEDQYEAEAGEDVARPVVAS